MLGTIYFLNDNVGFNYKQSIYNLTSIINFYIKISNYLMNINEKSINNELDESLLSTLQ